MTPTVSPPTPRRRLEDQGRRGRVLAAWRRWGQLATGLWLVVVSVAVMVVSVAFLREQDRTRDAARASCERARSFGPALARAYQRYAILTPAELRAYRATIPETCP